MNPDDNPSAPDDPDEPHPITLLSSIYLELGLPLEAAAQSAIADYESIFDHADLCAV
jgi:hypothetical protein